MFQSDFLSDYQKRKKYNNEGVEVLESILTYKEIKEIKDKKKRKELIDSYVEKYGKKDLAERWGINQSTLNSHLNRLKKEFGKSSDGYGAAQNSGKDQQEGKFNGDANEKKRFQIIIKEEMTGAEIQDEVLDIFNALKDENKYIIELNVMKVVECVE